MKIWMTTFFILGLTFGTVSLVAAQEDPNLNPTEEQQKKEKAEKEKKAYILLEQVVDEAQLLRMPENLSGSKLTPPTCFGDAMRDVLALYSRWPARAWLR